MKRKGIEAGLNAVLLLTLLTQLSDLSAVRSTAVEAAGESITLQWTDTGASWYEVYRAAPCGGSYTLLARTAAPAYKEGGLQRGNVYFYKVHGVRRTDVLYAVFGNRGTLLRGNPAGNGNGEPLLPAGQAYFGARTDAAQRRLRAGKGRIVCRLLEPADRRGAGARRDRAGRHGLSACKLGIARLALRRQRERLPDRRRNDGAG